MDNGQVQSPERVVCAFERFQREKSREVELALVKVSEVHSAMSELIKHASHLSKLDALEDIKNSLIGPATGRDQMQTKTVNMIVKILGVVIIGLLATLVFIITGKSLGWLSIHPS